MSQKKRIAPVCEVLPKDARDALIAASQLTDPMERKVAIQQATERAQRKYSQFYQSPKEGAAQ